MRRRDFLVCLGSGAVTWPLTARAQQPVIRVVGFLHSGREAAQRGSVDAFLQGLEDAGFVEGRNVAIVFRWANIQFARVPALAADLVRREVAVLVAAGGTVLSAKAATDTIPIVAIGSIDLVKWGLVASLSRPGGNITGITFLSNQLMGKRLDFLRKMVPETTTIGFLTTTGDTTSSGEQTSYLLEAARSLGCEIIVVKCRSERDFENAFATFTDSKAGALVVGDSAFLANNGGKITVLAAFHKMPTMCSTFGYVRGGALMSYGADMAAGFRQAGSLYVARILGGQKPADLPVQQPTKFELAINMKTATALGLKVPATLLAIADKVIE